MRAAASEEKCWNSTPTVSQRVSFLRALPVYSCVRTVIPYSKASNRAYPTNVEGRGFEDEEPAKRGDEGVREEARGWILVDQ